MAPVKKKPAESTSKRKTGENKGKETACTSIAPESVPLKDIPINVVKQFDLLQRNGPKGSMMHRSGERIISQRLKHFSVFTIMNCFDRRVTCISWHPTDMFFIAASKAGDMTMFSYCNDRFDEKFRWPGPGPGLSVLSIHHLDLIAPNQFLTACIDGTVKLWDTENTSVTPVKTLMSTGTLQRWFCSVNSCKENNVILVGDTKGNLITIDKNLKVVSTDKIHKNKVNSVEFSCRGGWTFATASVDQTVKLFDLRKLNAELQVFQHNKGVNSAYFSKTGSGRLLTTDQDCDLRIYKGPVWQLERTIKHPHRQFMHVTPIRATWHPLADLVVVGRYPDPSKSDLKHMSLRTVDIFSAETGNLTTELYSSSCSGILSLNEFSPTGEFLASGMGLYIPLWRLTHSVFSNNFSLETPDENKRGRDNDKDVDDFSPPKPKKPKKQENNKKGGKLKS